MKLNNGEKPQSAKVAGAQSEQVAQERGDGKGGGCKGGLALRVAAQRD